MSEIEITLPTVQYGNVKIRATPEELGLNDISDSYELGVAAAVYLNLFSQGFKYGAALDVDAPQKPSAAPQGAAQSEETRTPDEVEKAAQILADGLGGVTEVTSEKAEQDAADIRAQHQAEAAGKAPWDAKVEAPKPKPWQSDGW